MLSSVPPILVFVLLLFLPETPYWLIEIKDKEGAKNSMVYFRGRNYSFQEELNEIIKQHDSKANYTKEGISSWKYSFSKILSKSFLKPFLCVGVLYFSNAWTGFVTITAYMIFILEYSGSTLDASSCILLVGIIQLLTAGNLYLPDFFP